ncbi:response regulator [Candidatus Borrarchaeum sp.]|uniref:response regulator n=1 Tax=Candidatus Borrarchaeum sp. TaxID=2846742 RepID=UPI00257B5311|nr:response regulator [Candidatus Borrarchaeum sp.]
MTIQISQKPLEILLIEDNPGDVRLTVEGFRETKAFNKLNVAYDGEEAMAFLRREGKFKKAPRPDLILLDLNLPKKDGREVLEEIKDDRDLKCIPVVILTTSHSIDDIEETYSNHANCYITKPVDLNQFVKVVKSIDDFWLNIVKLPNKETGDYNGG